MVGLDGFVAHKDIEPGSEWVRVITAALHSCDALVALLHDGFKASNWCDQEVGGSVGRAVPVVPIKVDLDPYGLLGMFQAVSWPKHNLRPERVVVGEIVKILLADKRTSERVVEAIVKQIESASSFKQANDLAGILATGSPSVSTMQVARLRAAQKANDQVARAYHVDAAVEVLENRLPEPLKVQSSATAAAPVYDYGVEPF